MMLRRIALALCLALVSTVAAAQFIRPGMSPGFRPGFRFMSGAKGTVPCPNGALSYYDFIANTGCTGGAAAASSVSDFTVTRSTVGMDLANTTQFAANVARRTSAGLLVEAASTNQVKNPNTYTTAAGWTFGSGSSATQNATDPNGVANGAWSATVSTAGPGIYQAVTGSGQATHSIWMRAKSGTPLLFLDVGNGNGQVQTLSTTWKRYAATGTSSSQYAEIRTDMGGAATVTIEIWSSQYEKAATSSSYIASGSAATTRAADSIVVPLPAATTKVDLSYDNGNTLTVAASPGNYTIPANPTGANLRYLKAY
jgi:hypothetical protein